MASESITFVLSDRSPPERRTMIKNRAPIAVALIVSTVLFCHQSTFAATALANEPSRDDLAKYAASLIPGNRAYPIRFRFPNDLRPNSVFGIDVSHYQGEVDWTTVAKQGVTFAFVKATQGSDYYDGSFRRNWKSLAELASGRGKIFRGAYHFMTATDDPSRQASNFLQTVGSAGSGDLPACLDVEWDFLIRDGKIVYDGRGNRIDLWSHLTSDQIVAAIRIWLKAIETASGKRPIIYTNAQWWAERVGSERSLRDYPLWIADYTSKSLGAERPNVPFSFSWWLWQLTDQGSLKLGGVNGLVDTTTFVGTSQEFRAQFHLNAR